MHEPVFLTCILQSKHESDMKASFLVTFKPLMTLSQCKTQNTVVDVNTLFSSTKPTICLSFAYPISSPSSKRMFSLVQTYHSFAQIAPPTLYTVAPAFVGVPTSPPLPDFFSATSAMSAAPTPLPSFAIPILILFSPFSPISGISLSASRT